MNLPKTLAYYLLRIAATALILGGLHFLWNYWQNEPGYIRERTLSFHIFIAVLTYIAGAASFVIGFRKFHLTGYVFLGLSVVKIAIAIGYLFPSLDLPKERAIPIFLHFFVPYFVYLMVEAYAILRFLNRHSPR